MYSLVKYSYALSGFIVFCEYFEMYLHDPISSSDTEAVFLVVCDPSMNKL